MLKRSRRGDSFGFCVMPECQSLLLGKYDVRKRGYSESIRDLQETDGTLGSRADLYIGNVLTQHDVASALQALQLQGAGWVGVRQERANLVQNLVLGLLAGDLQFTGVLREANLDLHGVEAT